MVTATLLLVSLCAVLVTVSALAPGKFRPKFVPRERDGQRPFREKESRGSKKSGSVTECSTCLDDYVVPVLDFTSTLSAAFSTESTDCQAWELALTGQTWTRPDLTTCAAGEDEEESSSSEGEEGESSAEEGEQEEEQEEEPEADVAEEGSSSSSSKLSSSSPCQSTLDTLQQINLNLFGQLCGIGDINDGIYISEYFANSYYDSVPNGWFSEWFEICNDSPYSIRIPANTIGYRDNGIINNNGAARVIDEEFTLGPYSTDCLVVAGEFVLQQIQQAVASSVYPMPKNIYVDTTGAIALGNGGDTLQVVAFLPNGELILDWITFGSSPEEGVSKAACSSCERAVYDRTSNVARSVSYTESQKCTETEYSINNEIGPDGQPSGNSPSYGTPGFHTGPTQDIACGSTCPMA